jgi:hypothetical protein
LQWCFLNSSELAHKFIHEIGFLGLLSLAPELIQRLLIITAQLSEFQYVFIGLERGDHLRLSLVDGHALTRRILQEFFFGLLDCILHQVFLLV